MNKDEKLIKKGEVYNGEEYYVNTTDVLAAMEKQAKAFAIWCAKNYHMASKNVWVYRWVLPKGKNDKEYTLAELYTEFNKNKK